MNRRSPSDSLPAARARAAAAVPAVDPRAEFAGWLFKAYKNSIGIEGKFKGKYTLEPQGSVDYVYRRDLNNPFRFLRSNGEEIKPSTMITDGSSRPRLTWVIDDFDPRAYIDAYVIHDWLT